MATIKGDIPMLQLAEKVWVDENGEISEFSNRCDSKI